MRDVRQVLENVESHAEAVVDARGAARFKGTAPEPRKGIRGGHIPGSLNVPFDSLLTDGRYITLPFQYAKPSLRGRHRFLVSAFVQHLQELESPRIP